MNRYIIQRTIPGAGQLSSDELQGISERSNSVLQGMQQSGTNVQWVQSFVTPDSIICHYLAPDEETIRQHASRGGFPADAIHQVVRIIDPMTAEKPVS